MTGTTQNTAPPIRVVAVAQFPPVEGVPTADGPINYAIARYARQCRADVSWVFTREPAHRPGWTQELASMGVQAARARSSLTRRATGAWAALAASYPVVHPRRVLLIAKESGALRAGLAEAIHRHQPDLVFLASPYAALLGSRDLGVPTVYNSMDSLTAALDNGSYGRADGPAAAVRRALMHRFDRFACANKDLTMFVTPQDAANAPYAERTATVGNGADVERFRPALPSEQADTPTLAFQGSARYLPNLRAIEIIVRDIAPAVWSSVPNAVFQFFGAGNESLEATLSGGDPRLRFVGYVDDLGAELRRAWVVLAPLEDGAGMKNKVLDAAASGVPSIGLPEAFSGLGRPDGTIEVGTPGELAAATVELLSDAELRAKLGTAARQYAESVGWPQQVARYVAAWRSVLGAHGSLAA